MTEVYKDIFLFKSALSQQEKDALWFIISQNYADYYRPKFKGKFPMNLRMTCLGKHWNPVDNKYYDRRIDHDDHKVKALPNTITNIVKKVALDAFPKHIPEWDIGVINLYDAATANGKPATLGMHRDNSESKETLASGHPVGSISLGASCTFMIGRTREPEKEIELEDGDVLLFGNSARLIYHGVKNVKGSRANFTIRKY